MCIQTDICVYGEKNDVDTQQTCRHQVRTDSKKDTDKRKHRGSRLVCITPKSPAKYWLQCTCTILCGTGVTMSMPAATCSTATTVMMESSPVANDMRVAGSRRK